MTNPQRGETAIEIDGQACVLRFTLEALAGIEAALGVDGFEALAGRMAAMSAGDLKTVLAALLRAGGSADADALAGRADPRAAARAVAACFAANLS